MAENILMFFQQKFCRSISNPDMDRLIVDQLGCMAIARTDNEDKVGDFLQNLQRLRCKDVDQRIDGDDGLYIETSTPSQMVIHHGDHAEDIAGV